MILQQFLALNGQLKFSDCIFFTRRQTCVLTHQRYLYFDMKVKKTYGKQKTALTAVVLPRASLNNDTLDENIWKDEKDTAFDLLLQNDEK